jgi:hypothetical protein
LAENHLILNGPVLGGPTTELRPVFASGIGTNPVPAARLKFQILAVDGTSVTSVEFVDQPSPTAVFDVGGAVVPVATKDGNVLLRATAFSNVVAGATGLLGESLKVGLPTGAATGRGYLRVTILGRPRTAWYGLRLGGGYSDLELSGRDGVVAPVTLTTDTYAVGAGILPAAPYAGSFAGPGAVIPDTPATRTATVVSGSADVGNEISGRMLGISAGPFLEIPLSEAWTVELGAGGTVLWLERSYRHQETLTVAGLPSLSRGFGATASDWMIGGEVSGRVKWHIRPELTAELGVRLQHLGSVSQTASGRTAKLRLDRALNLLVGLSYSF